MKISNLTDHIEFQEYSVDIPSQTGEPIITIKRQETCLVLGENQRIIQTVFVKVLNKVRADSSTNSILINCEGQEYFPRREFQNSESITTEINVRTVQDLISALENILACTSDAIMNMERELRAILISNISSFYWTLHLLNDENYQNLGFKTYIPPSNIYLRLSHLFKHIARKYHCIVIVFGFDFHFDCGLSAEKYCPQSDLQKLSKLPSLFLSSFTHIVHKGRVTEERFYRELQKWR